MATKAKEVTVAEAVVVTNEQEARPSEQYFADFDFSKGELSMEAMLKAGVHFGHMKSRRHPRMDEYIYTTRNGISILDLQKTLVKLKTAADFLVSVRRAGRDIVFVATKKQARGLVRSLAERLRSPYVVERWLGGTFTNFSVIRGRGRYLCDMQEQGARGEFKKYTKFEQARLHEELEKLEKRVGGIKYMEELPGAVFVADVKDSGIVAREARAKGVPVVGIVDTNADPSLIDYPIPANDDAVSALRYLLAMVGKFLVDVPVVPVVPAKGAPSPIAPVVPHQ